MEFKEGMGWKCCFDPDTGRYTAQIGGGVNCDLYEITKEIYDKVDDPEEKPIRLIIDGRHLCLLTTAAVRHIRLFWILITKNCVPGRTLW